MEITFSGIPAKYALDIHKLWLYDYYSDHDPKLRSSWIRSLPFFGSTSRTARKKELNKKHFMIEPVLRQRISESLHARHLT